MMIALLLLSLASNLQGAPLVGHPHVHNEDLTNKLIPQSDVIFGTRTTGDIVVTCLATILACTWTAIHPNIPAPDDSGFDIFKRRLITLLYALIAPEAITTWALRQRLAAKRIANEYNKVCATDPSPIHPPRTPDGFSSQVKASHTTVLSRIIKGPLVWLLKRGYGWFQRSTITPQRQDGEVEKWKTTHGFFLQMGGFMLSERGRPLRTLRYFSEDQRKLFSYGCYHYADCDMLRNVMEKKIGSPTLTEADIHDKSKGDVISKTVVVLQTTWFFAQCVARWATRLPVTELEVITMGFVALNGLTYAFWWDKPQNVGVPVYLEWISEEAPPGDATFLTKRSFFREQIKVLQKNGPNLERIQILLSVPFEPLSRLLTGECFAKDEPPHLRVFMFHSNHPESITFITMTMTAVAVGFGAVHLIPAWFLIFPSRTYMYLWRVSAVVITAAPLSIPLIQFINRAKIFPESRFLGDIVRVLVLGPTPLYIIARIILFTIALLSLRDLPRNAFTTVQWLAIFPHF